MSSQDSWMKPGGSVEGDVFTSRDPGPDCEVPSVLCDACSTGQALPYGKRPYIVSLTLHLSSVV